ncbi:hypothetical protein D3C73_1210740 [compost metagenome]
MTQFVRQFRIGDQCAAEHDKVCISGFDKLHGAFWRMAARVKDWDVYNPTGRFAHVIHTGITQISRRENIIDPLIRPGIDIDRIYTRALQDLQHLQAVLYGTAALEPVIKRNAEQDWHVWADSFTDCLHDLHGKAHPLLCGAAVLVLTMIPKR